MRKLFLLAMLFVIAGNFAVSAQTRTAAANAVDLTQFGVRVQPSKQLIVVMAALESAGFDENAKNVSPFRQQLRQDLQTLDPDLRRRMRDFFERNNRNFANASATDQAARYVTLAYALDAPPNLTAPQRSPDLPDGLLEVLDFVPLVREFYRKFNLDEKLPNYVRLYQQHGDDLRASIARAVGDTSGYLNTRPQLSYSEKVLTTAPTKKKNGKGGVQSVESRPHDRAFYVVPDLLGASNSAKLRVIGDNYYAIIGAAIDPQNSVEFRRAYLQFLIDPLVIQNAKTVAANRDAVRGLLDELAQRKQREFETAKAQNKLLSTAVYESQISPDPFLATVRSLVAAAEIRQRKNQRIERLALTAQIAAAKKQPVDQQEVKVVNNRLTFPRAEAEAFGELSEAYDSGAVLAFFFDDKLRAQDTASFDIAGAFADMLAQLDGNAEKARLKQTETARAQAVIDLRQRRTQIALQAAADSIAANSVRNNPLIAGLNAVETLLAAKNYDEAEARLNDLQQQNPGEPRVFYALGRTASLSAQTAFDEDLQKQRLDKAVAHYQTVLAVANPETDKGLLSNTHVALGKIYEFYDRNNDALKEFDAAIALGEIQNGAFREAANGKARLTAKK